MLLTKYTIKNFGIFKGEHTFDLQTNDEVNGHKPLVIFGGRNGAGKTTLFEGIKLCLYGSAFRGYGLSRSQYEKYLMSRIYRHGGLSEHDGSSVSLEFQHSHLGTISTYLAKRSWNTSHPVKDKLELFQDGKSIEGIADDQLQDFLMELIPLGLSKLFFFDGEQIQNLAQDTSDNKYLIDAFNSLLGLDIIEHLQTDLRIHLSRQMKGISTVSDKKLQVLFGEKITIESELNRLCQTRAQKQTEMDHNNAEVERMEHQISLEGGGFAARREDLKIKKTALEAQILELEERIREHAASFLPFALVPHLCMALKERLLKEERYQQIIATKEYISNASIELKKKLSDDFFWEGIWVNEGERNIIASKVIQYLQTITLPEPHEQTEYFHQLSVLDKEKLFHWIEQSINWLPAKLKMNTERLEGKIIELRNAEETLSRVPPDEALGPLVQGLNVLYEHRGGIIKEMKTLDEKIKQNEYRLKDIERQVGKHIEEQDRMETTQTRIELGNVVQDILKEFSKTLRKIKLGLVSEEFVSSFNELSEKKNLIDRVRIIDEDFSITLFRRNGTILSKDELSAGEKQLYAIAMLAALARISGKPLPFIIDTPLARLDIEHRMNLVSNFFPKVSHQVIIFSTNTEIDQKSFDILTPYVSKSYLLQYNEKAESTLPSQGYFWERR